MSKEQTRLLSEVNEAIKTVQAGFDLDAQYIRQLLLNVNRANSDSSDRLAKQSLNAQCLILDRELAKLS